MGGKVHRLCEAVRPWTVRHDLLIVVVLSLLHIGLSCMHARESGTPHHVF
jgi:hypothetical protein